jgi:uncharacterized Fe-S cluster protein YjdI
MEKIKEYSNGEVTIVWKPTVCIHSAKCVQGLPDVFKPRDKPWIQLENSNTEAIIKTVKTCPSGALSFYMNTKGKTDEVSNKTAANTTVEVLDNGPLMVYGPLSVKHSDGREEQKDRNTAFCRCGKSDNKPFCDGSHRK